MNSGLRNRHEVKPSVMRVGLITALSALGCMLLGYLFLPLAAAFYASLVFYEKKNGGVLSYIIPVATFIINIGLNGFYSVEGVAYVAVGAAVYFLFKSGKTKGESAVYVTALVFCFILISAVLVAFDSLGTLRISSIGDYYVTLYYNLRDGFIDLVADLVVTDKDGIVSFLTNRPDAIALFNSAVYLLLPIFVVASFAITGFTFKIFSGRLLKFSDDKEAVLSWTFGTSSLVAYFYVAVAILSVFGATGAFGLVVTSIDLIFSVVFAYIGFRVSNVMLTSKKGQGFALLVLLGSLILFSAFAFRVLSYLGVYFTVLFNNSKKENTPNI